jgi:hypothetical protein
MSSPAIKGQQYLWWHFTKRTELMKEARALNRAWSLPKPSGGASDISLEVFASNLNWDIICLD